MSNDNKFPNLYILSHALSIFGKSNLVTFSLLMPSGNAFSLMQVLLLSLENSYE
jgi:hypothetical protein